MDTAENTQILLMCKAPKTSKHFNANQRLWIIRLTGSQAAEVKGKYKGKGRYIQGWIKWDKPGDTCPKIIEVSVTKSFYEKIRANATSAEGYPKVHETKTASPAQ